MILFDSQTAAVNRRFQKETYYIGRGSIWGNPFTSIQNRQTKAQFVVATRQDSVEAYRGYLLNNPTLLWRLLELNGHKLGCFCKPESCHGDILVWALKGLILMMNTYKVPVAAIDFTNALRVKQLVFFADQAAMSKTPVEAPAEEECCIA